MNKINETCIIILGCSAGWKRLGERFQVAVLLLQFVATFTDIRVTISLLADVFKQLRTAGSRI
jgi:TRAP-type C4-dicarboxylate transport system permease large subunit